MNRDPIGRRLVVSLAQLALVCAVLLQSGCASYEFIGKFVQNDHPMSEFGYGALSDVEDRSKWDKQEGSGESLQQPKPLQKGRRTYVILQIDGGGIMGIAPSRLVHKIEAAIHQRPGMPNARLCDVLSVCSGTSTGAIITGGIAAGVPGEHIADFYYTKGYALFQGEGRLPLAPVFQHVLDREAFQEKLIETIDQHGLYDPSVRMGELDRVPVLSLAAYDLVGKKTVFLRNERREDSPVNTEDIQLIDAISASALSAAVYFGKLLAPEVTMKQVRADGETYLRKGAAFADGGQGTQNSTIELCAIEALRMLQADPGAQVVLISLGCGNEYEARKFSEVIEYNGFDQLSDYLFRNQARSESILLQWMTALDLEDLDNRLHVYRFDWEHDPKKASAFSINEEQRKFLVDTAEEMAARPDFRQLITDLSDSRIPLTQFRRN